MPDIGGEDMQGDAVTDTTGLYLVLQANAWLRYTKYIDVNKLNAMLRAATFVSGLGNRPAKRFMDPQHHDSAHCKKSDQFQTSPIISHHCWFPVNLW